MAQSQFTFSASSIPNDITEEWRPILGYNGAYEVSNYGRVRSYRANNRKGELSSRPRLLVADIDQRGYVRYDLFLDGKYKHCTAHRLVLSTFLGDCDLQVNHKDGNKSNNFIGNLEWVTNSENLRHAREVLKKRFGAHDGEKHHNAKLDEARVREIRALLAMGMSQYAIAAQFGVSRGSISDIHLGRTWREP